MMLVSKRFLRQAISLGAEGYIREREERDEQRMNKQEKGTK